MMTEEDWGGEAPLKVSAERKKNFLIKYIYLSAYRINKKKTVNQRSDYQTIAQDSKLAG